MTKADFTSGFAAIVGRPNAGKSTFLNAAMGTKVAITSDRPQTTRRVIRAIITRPDGQLILVDTPGIHRPRTLLGQRLNEEVKDTYSTVDAVALCIPANETIGPGDRFIAESIAGLSKSINFALVTKTDLVNPEQLVKQLIAVEKLGTELGVNWSSIIPVSAKSNDQVDVVIDELMKAMPQGPQFFPEDTVTDEPEEIFVSELIREAALKGVQDELPHSIAVVIEEMSLREDRPENFPLTDIYASLFVERDSQKAIVIGKGGSRLKRVGSESRAEIEKFLGTAVFLDLRVKVAKDWQRNPKQLRRLGF
ncbi:MAG: GTPase Era [Actinomycetia bacterium]|jgi:GTP-binding protein Era|nr:GTPase Era [Actinomycetes bacterium]